MGGLGRVRVSVRVSIRVSVRVRVKVSLGIGAREVGWRARHKHACICIFPMPEGLLVATHRGASARNSLRLLGGRRNPVRVLRVRVRAT